MEKQNLYYIYDSVWAGMYADFKPFYEETDPRMRRISWRSAGTRSGTISGGMPMRYACA